jgi:hypothetical protein
MASSLLRFFYGTAKFYAHRLEDDGDEKLPTIAAPTGQTPFTDPLFESIDLKGDPIPPPIMTDFLAEFIVRKTTDRLLVIPVDHVICPDADTVRRRLIENHRRIVGLIRGKARRAD